MSFTVWFGLHGAAAEEFDSAREAYEGALDLERRGAKFLQVVGPDGTEMKMGELADLASRGEEAS